MNIEQYKKTQCPKCKHYKTSYPYCNICKCIDGNANCVEYKKEGDTNGKRK